jgi:hypothetical protein
MPKRREHLIIGCGHAYGACNLSHPAADFETIDWAAKRKPNVLLDINDQDAFALHYQDTKFSSIIFEFIDVPNAVPYLKAYIKDDGNLVHVGAGLFETMASLQVGQRCFVLSSDEGHLPSITIIPQGEKFSIDPVLRKYLQAVTKNNKFQMHEISVTDALKQRAALLQEMHKELAKKAPYFPDGFVLAVLLAEPDKTPITAGQLRKITETYSPGWLRRHVSGKTRGMGELEKFLSQYEDSQVLQEPDLGPLLTLIQNRQWRVSNSKNPTRDAQGSTMQVFKQIAVSVLNYWISNFSGVSAAPDETRDLRL